jgi:parallel beta-helix repeat protein
MEKNTHMILALFLLVVLCNNAFYAQSRYVTPTSQKILYVGGFGQENYSTIQEAVYDAISGDTVYVYNGTYFESIKINKTINLVGEGKNSTIIDGIQESYCIKICANNSSISNFTIRNSSLNATVIVGTGTVIINNIIRDNGYLAISMKNSCKANISHNHVCYNVRGICQCLHCCNSFISHNLIENNDYCAIYVYKSENITLYKNQILNNKCGIILSLSSNSKISQNQIKNCNQLGVRLYRSSNNTIQKNNFLKSMICSVFSCCKNKWYENYWERPRRTPKPIPGLRQIKCKIFLPAVEFDMTPSLRPYNIN